MKHRRALAEDAIVTGLPESTRQRLALYVELVLRWQPTINLIGKSTVADIWARHIGDSLQVKAAAPHASRWVDLGSGGGFPGVVTAILLADTPGAVVHLVESDKRKAAFLRTVSRETGAPAQIHAERIEIFVPRHDDPVDAVSARALAPLPQLVAFAEKFLFADAVGVFHKGQTVEAELTDLRRDNRFHAECRPSAMQDGSSLVIVTVAQAST